MQYTGREWMMDLVVFIEPEMTVSDALALMRRRYIQSLIVKKTETSPDYGILTSTDISDKIVAQGRNPVETKVKDIMSSPLLTVDEGMSLRDCAITMKEHRIHHLPVVDGEGTIVGMISSTDFMVAAEAMGRAPRELS